MQEDSKISDKKSALGQKSKIASEIGTQKSDKNTTFNKENSSQLTKNNKKEESPPGFVCSEATIEFKDFVDGKVYLKSLELTNAANSQNAFRSLTIESKYKDFFEISHQRVGYVASGMSIPFKISFFPKERINISTHLVIDCEIGRTVVPIKCFYVKTKITFETVEIQIPETIIGEESQKVIRMSNKGGLCSKFEVITPSRSNYLKANNKNLNNSFNSSISLQGMNNQLNSNNNLSLDGQNSDAEKNSEVQVVFEKEILHKQLYISCPKIIEGYSDIEIQFVFRPVEKSFEMIGEVVIKFENSIDQPDIVLKIYLKALNLPILLSQGQFDLGICLLDSLYREKVTVKNDSNKTSKVEIKCPPELSEYFIFSPTFSFVQPKSEFVFWVKVKLIDRFLVDCAKFLDKEKQTVTCEFELHSSIQLTVLKFSITLTLSSEELIFPKKLEFGLMYQNTAKSLPCRIKNNSQVTQKILFDVIPANFKIEPELNPWVFLPQEEFTFNVIYRCTKVGNEHGSIKIKVLVGQEKGKEIEIAYSVSVFECQLELSAHRIDFQVAQEDETINYKTRIKNKSSKTIKFEVTEPPIEFSGLTFSPFAGTINPGKSANIFIEFQAAFRAIDYQLTSKLNEEDEKIDSLNALLLENQQKLKDVMVQLGPKEKIFKTLLKPELEKLETQRMYLTGKLEELQVSLQNHLKEKEQNFDVDQVLQTFGGSLKNYYFEDPKKKLQALKWIIPISFKGEAEPDSFASSIFMEINTAVKSKILIIDRQEIDFGKVVIGTRKVERFTLKNESEMIINLKMDIAPYLSGFQFLGCLKPIFPGDSKTYCVSFEPIDDREPCEDMRFYDTNSVNLRLRGKGVYPEIEIEDNVKFIDMGSVMINEEVEKTFKIKNQGVFTLDFEILANSIGRNNKNGKKTFFTVPHRGQILPNESKTIKVIFQPSEVDDNYAEIASVFINKSKSKKQIYLKGSGFDRQGYVKPVFEFNDDLLTKFQSGTCKDLKSCLGLSDLYSNEKSFFLKIERNMSETDQNAKQVQKLVVGCCKLLKSNLEKPVEYEFNFLNHDFDGMFKITNQKGKLTPGQSTEMVFEYVGNIEEDQNKKESKDSKAPKKTESKTNGKNYQDFLPDEIKKIGRWIRVEGCLKISGGFSLNGEDFVSYNVILEAYMNKI